MENQQLLELTADVVAAHVSNNAVAIADVPQLVQSVHKALAGLAEPGEDKPEPKEPAVSIRASIKPDYLICLACGMKHKMLKRHLRTAHDMSPDDYREAYGLKADYPMVSANYAKLRSKLAKKIGLGRKPKASGTNAAPKRKASPAQRSGGRKKAAKAK